MTNASSTDEAVAPATHHTCYGWVAACYLFLLVLGIVGSVWFFTGRSHDIAAVLLLIIALWSSPIALSWVSVTDDTVIVHNILARHVVARADITGVVAPASRFVAPIPGRSAARLTLRSGGSVRMLWAWKSPAFGCPNGRQIAAYLGVPVTNA